MSDKKLKHTYMSGCKVVIEYDDTPEHIREAIKAINKDRLRRSKGDKECK